MQSLRFQMIVLTSLQALLLTNNVTLFAVSSLAGFALADDKALATLPITGYVLGAAMFSMLTSRLMRIKGRRFGYTVGALLACIGALLAAWAVTVGNLGVLIVNAGVKNEAVIAYIESSGVGVIAFQMYFFAGFAMLAALVFGLYAKRYKMVDHYRA